MASDLVGAIVDAATTALPGFTGGFWNGESEEDTQPPLAVLVYAVEEEEQFSNGGYLEKGTLTCTVYAVESADATAKIKQYADWIALKETKESFLWGAGQSTVRRVMRRNVNHVPSELRDADTNVVYQTTAAHQIMVQGRRPTVAAT